MIQLPNSAPAIPSMRAMPISGYLISKGCCSPSKKQYLVLTHLANASAETELSPLVFVLLQLTNWCAKILLAHISAIHLYASSYYPRVMWCIKSCFPRSLYVVISRYNNYLWRQFRS